MYDAFIFPNILFANIMIFLILCFLTLTIVYSVVKIAVRNGVREANERLIESVMEIEKAVTEIKKARE